MERTDRNVAQIGHFSIHDWKWRLQQLWSKAEITLRLFASIIKMILPINECTTEVDKHTTYCTSEIVLLTYWMILLYTLKRKLLWSLHFSPTNISLKHLILEIFKQNCRFIFYYPASFFRNVSIINKVQNADHAFHCSSDIVKYTKACQ